MIPAAAHPGLATPADDPEIAPVAEPIVDETTPPPDEAGGEGAATTTPPYESLFLPRSIAPLSEAWKSRAYPLADWTLEHLVNRDDCHGKYVDVMNRRGNPRERTSFTKKAGITRSDLYFHYWGPATGCLVGLHSTRHDAFGQCWCKWVAVDVDRHGEGGDPESNLRFALSLRTKLAALGIDCLVLDSNGRGGIHLLVVFACPIPAGTAYRFAKWLVGGWKESGLVEEPETFPKQGCIKEGGFGNWLRLPGRHHTREHFTRVWTEDSWLEGAEAADAILTLKLTDAEKIPGLDLGPEVQAVEAQPWGEKGKRHPPGPAAWRPRLNLQGDVELARDALNSLSTMVDGYDDWLRVGMSLTSLGESGLDLWEGWSRASSKYRPGACAEKWAGFDDGPGGLKLGSLFTWASAAGWVRPGARQPGAASDDNLDGADFIRDDPHEPGDGGEAEPGPTIQTSSWVNKAPEDPFRLAGLLIDGSFRHPEGPTLVYHLEQFYRWDGSAYAVHKDAKEDLVVATEAEFIRLNLKAIRDQKDKDNSKGKGKGDEGNGKLPVARRVSTKIINDALQALRAKVLLPSNLAAPCWIERGREPGDDLPSPLSILPAANGLVDLDDLSIRPNTPRFFSYYSLNYAFDRDAPMPASWGRFLRSLWPDDPASIRQLQKWFGLQLTLDTSYQKFLLLIGPPRSGKGTIIRVLQKMIGEKNLVAPALSSFATDFGLSALIGKAACVITDARVAGNSSVRSAILERLLNITGEDPITIDRKYKDATTQKMAARITISANEPPNFRDASGALAARAIFLKLTESWKDREDLGLTERLYGEMPGILNWSIDGLAMLREDGRFSTPQSAAGLHESFRDMLSPIATFADEACELITPDARDAEDLNTTQDVFKAYCEWCRETKHTASSDSVFGRDFLAAFPSVEKTRPRIKTTDASGDRVETRFWRFQGVRLTAIGNDLLRRANLRDQVHPAYSETPRFAG